MTFAELYSHSMMKYAILLLLTLTTAAYAETVRLFTVGNSFSQNATHYLADIAKANGDTLILGTANIGGSSFAVHWKKVLEHQKDPKAKAGLYTMGRGLKEWLQSDAWDYVTIQQASRQSHDIANYRPSAKQLADYIRQHAPKAKLMLHQTWAYRVDDPWFTTKQPIKGNPTTQDAMYRGLKSAYITIAQELSAGLIPVGDAFHLADTDAQWGYRAAPFDSKKAKPSELPDQAHSLHVGWTWKNNKLSMDGHHANVAGEYLGACVWYEVFFGKSAVGNSFLPKGLDAADAKFLQQTAHRAVSSPQQ